MLETSPLMGKVEYPCSKFSELAFDAVLYCVYDKAIIQNMPRSEKIYPTRFFLEIEKFGLCLNVTSHEKNEQSGLLLTMYEIPAKMEHFYQFLEKVQFLGHETDVDRIYTKPYSFYPLHSYAKRVMVKVRPAGLDEKGQVVWHIVM